MREGSTDGAPNAAQGSFVTHVLGARPNLMKAVPVIDALRALQVEQRLVHTGQHYDALLSDVFFNELSLPDPEVNLGVGSGTHAEQTAAAMVGLEREFLEHRPALCVVYGDINSTVAAALAASKLLLPVAHVEAGLRSFDDTMPEEVNRRIADSLAELLFVTCPEGLENLGREGIDSRRTHFVGNPMIDTLYSVRERLDAGPVLRRFGIASRFGLVTLHRPGNVDDPARAKRIVDALSTAARHLELIVPLHPRGHDRLVDAGLERSADIHVTAPLGYLDFMALMSAAAVVITDSGGIQEETTALGVPCLTLRPNTERPITLSHGTNRLVEPEAIESCVEMIVTTSNRPTLEPLPLWDGRSGERIAGIIDEWLRERGAGRRDTGRSATGAA